jgi:capsular polysaccharide biosynthesis protein
MFAIWSGCSKGPERSAVVQESSLRKILAVLRARLLLVVLLAVPVLLMSAWYAATRPPTYTSEVVLTFTPEPLASPDVSFIRLLPRYLTVATGPESLQAAAAAADVPVAALRDSVTATNPGGSVEMQLGATTLSPASSQLAAASLADSVITATDADPLVSASILEDASEPQNATRLRQLAALGAGVSLCLLPGVSLAFALEGARPRIRVREDLEALGVGAPFAVRRRQLARNPSELAALALEVRAAAGGGAAPPVTVSSPTSSEADEVSGLAAALEPATDGSKTYDAESEQGVPAGLVAAPGLLTDEAARSAVLRSSGCVLVLISGTTTERAQDCVRLLERLDVRLIAAVLLH